ncbi:hypothetical protein HanPI659440_Chr12g0454371 [Helianthus annuus]|nr:hypothetical protein HanPI659440_Chr12g0454371 [Helianthus annuus]
MTFVRPWQLLQVCPVELGSRWVLCCSKYEIANHCGFGYANEGYDKLCEPTGSSKQVEQE